MIVNPILTPMLTPIEKRLHWNFSDPRGLSALEFLLGAFIVIGHHVFHKIPNEVPILFGLGLLSSRLRNGNWFATWFKRPAAEEFNGD